MSAAATTASVFTADTGEGKDLLPEPGVGSGGVSVGGAGGMGGKLRLELMEGSRLAPRTTWVG